MESQTGPLLQQKANQLGDCRRFPENVGCFCDDWHCDLETPSQEVTILRRIIWWKQSGCLSTIYCVLGLPYTWYYHRVPGNWPDLPRYSLWFSFPEMVPSSCKLSLLHNRSTQNVHKWCINMTDTSMGSLLANSTFDASFGGGNVSIYFCF